ncbi:Sodium-coupled monocarboxylate transporter 2 [Armadillidium vulgare]|nr:Sodium-coupled monocarboxylate transporter 2 [Armadillidium vulgare]
MKGLIASGIGLYSPTLILASITKLDTLTNILLLGIVCTIYSSFGGIRAVIWTDVFQLIIMLIGLITILAVGITHNGGLAETLYTASKGGRLEMFDYLFFNSMSLSPFVQYTFINTLAYGFFDGIRKYILDQASFQRLYTVKSVKESRSVLKFNIYGNLIMLFLMFLGGIVAYSSFVGCDPMALGLIKKRDQIFPYFAMNRLNIVPGLPGLFAATIMGGALSTLSSMMNSCTALIWRDIFLKFKLFKISFSLFATLTSRK